MECTEGRPSNHFALGCSLWARQILQHYMIQRERERETGGPNSSPSPVILVKNTSYFYLFLFSFSYEILIVEPLREKSQGYLSHQKNILEPHLTSPYHTYTFKSESTPLIPIPCVHTSLDPHLSSQYHAYTQVWIRTSHPLRAYKSGSAYITPVHVYVHISWLAIHQGGLHIIAKTFWIYKDNLYIRIPKNQFTKIQKTNQY